MHSDCPDFDLCEGCEAHPIPVHPDRHPLLKIKSIETVIPNINNGREGPNRSVSPPATTLRPNFYDYENEHTYNPPVSSTEPVTPSLVPRLDMPPHLGSNNSYFPAEDQSSNSIQPYFASPRYVSCPSRSPLSTISPSVSCASPFIPPAYSIQSYVPQYIPYPSGSPSIGRASSPILPAHTYAGFTSPFIAQSDTRGSPGPSDPSPFSSRPVTPVWQPFYDPTMNNPFKNAQEAASSLDAQNRSPPATSHGTWVSPSHNLDHLIQEQPSLPVAPKSVYEEAREIVNRNNISTPFQSPLGNEALLNRPASMNVLEPPDVAPVSSANRSLAALLDDYHSTTSLAPSSLAASVDEQEAPGDLEVQKPLTADFVADITVPDGQNFPPGAEFVKCWRMVNDGERDWPESTELVFVAGISLFKESSPPNVKVGLVKVGSEVDLWTGELKVRSFGLAWRSK